MSVTESALPLSPRKSREKVEWTDPETNEVFFCPKRFLEQLQVFVQRGRAKCQTADVLLAAMGEKVNRSNARHLRSASNLLQQLGIPVVSIRSIRGGYFLAESMAEVEAYTESNRKFANSMLRNADKLEALARRLFVK